jgi:chemotaxis protein methyltransferase CheR
VLPAIIEERRESRELHIWCAASSSGQEPYTVAMVIRERFPQLSAWNASILATDISPTMLARTKEGVYSQLEVNRGLDGARLARHFEQSGRDWRARRELRALVKTRALNLIEPFPTLPRLDLVFLRNVLIYFDAATKTRILDKVRRVMSPTGWLFLGAAESTLMLDVGFKREHFGPSVVYRPR